MESDLSLIEFSEEDDTLLPQNSNNKTANVDKYLSCSPLVRSAKPPRASKLDRMVDEHAPKSIRASPSYKYNKENTGAIKPEVSNLSNDPQQMKQRTKGGGYNLRKSIAWNRAFFTDAGVLDPSELSLINGAFNKSSRGALSSVQEEGSSSLCIVSAKGSAALDENISKEFPGSNKKKGKGASTCLSPKFGSSARHGASSSSMPSRKAFSAHDVNRSGSKRGGYSRPLASPSASPSQKRPANASTTKPVIRESKIPVMKSISRSLPASTRSATLTKQSVGRALTVQKDVGFKAASNSRRILERGTKTGPGSNSLSSKPSSQPLRRNMARQTPVSTNLQYPKVVNSSSPGLIQVPEIQANATQSSNAHDESTNHVVPLQQNPKNTSGNMQSGLLQAKKPSSLRMPSPSLGFFNQSKASGSHSLSESGAPPCKIKEIGIPRLQKLGSTVPDSKLRPTRAPGKKLEVVNDATTVRKLNGASKNSSLVNSVSLEKRKLNLQMSDKIPQLNHEHAEASKIKNLSFEWDGKMEVGDKKILKSRSYDQLEINNKHIADNEVCMGSGNFSGNEMKISKLLLGTAEQVIAVSQINLITEHPQVEDKKNNLTAEDHDSIAEDESQPRNDQRLIMKSTFDLDVQPEQDDLPKSCFVEASRASSEVNNVTQTSDCILFHGSVSSESFSNIDIDNASLVKSEFEILNSVEPAEIDSVLIKSHGVESDSMKLSVYEVDSQSLMNDRVSENLEELPELQDSCLVKECHEMHLRDVQVEGESGMNSSVGELHMELVVDNSGLFSDSQSVDVISSSDQLVLIKSNDCTNGTHDVDEPSADQLELTNDCTFGSDQIIPDENEKPQAINNKLIEENNYFDAPLPLSGYKCTEEPNEEAAKVDSMTGNSHLGDAKVQSLDDNQCIEDFSISLTHSIDYHDYPTVSFYVNVNPCSSSDETREKNIDVPGRGEFDELKCSDYASGSESKVDGVLSSVPLVRQEVGIANVDETGSLFHEENMAEFSIKTETFVENQTNLGDAQVSGTAENLKESHLLGEESELLTQTISKKADSKSYLYDTYEKNHMVHRNNENLPEQTISFEKIQIDDGNHVTDTCFNVRDCGSEPENSPSSCQHNTMEEANEFANREKVQLSDGNLITESLQCDQNISEMHNQLIGDVDDAKEVSKEILNKSSLVLCELNNEQPLLHQSITRMKNDDQLEEVGTQNSSSPNSELTNKRDNVCIPTEDDDATKQLKKPGNDEKQEALVIKPPPNAAPFSDEWLAAIEAAGEDILTMKTGAVQHSPTEKSVTELNPYSPVKRKNNQEIGPFDCTKFTNTSQQDSH